MHNSCAATRITYGHALSQFFEFVGKTQIKNVTMLKVEQFLLQKTSRGKPSKNNFNLKLSVVRAFFDYLVHQDVVKKNPTQYIKTKKIRTNYSTRALTREETEHILSKLTSEAHLAALIMLRCGLRLSEVASLRRSNFKLIFDQQSRRKYCLQIMGKGSYQRSMFIQQEVVKAAFTVFNNNKHLIDTPLFHSKKGACVKPAAIYFKIKRQLTKMGYSKVTPHWFRHTFASQLQQQTDNVVMVSKALGHKSLDTTQRYLKDFETVDLTKF